MIYRRIFKTRIVGSQKTGNLRSALSEHLPEGINLDVLEYGDDFAIVECWCSDHSILKATHRKTMEDLKNFDSHPAVMERVVSHPSSPPILGALLVSKALVEEVNEKAKTLTFKGMKAPYIRMIRQKPHGEEKELYILDEG